MKGNPDYAKKEKDSANAKMNKSSEAPTGSRVPKMEGTQAK